MESRWANGLYKKLEGTASGSELLTQTEQHNLSLLNGHLNWTVEKSQMSTVSAFGRQMDGKVLEKDLPLQFFSSSR